MVDRFNGPQSYYALTAISRGLFAKYDRLYYPPAAKRSNSGIRMLPNSNAASSSSADPRRQRSSKARLEINV